MIQILWIVQNIPPTRLQYGRDISQNVWMSKTVSTEYSLYVDQISIILSHFSWVCADKDRLLRIILLQQVVCFCKIISWQHKTWLYLLHFQFIHALRKTAHWHCTKELHQFVWVISPASQHFSEYKRFLPGVLIQCPRVDGWPALRYGVVKQSCRKLVRCDDIVFRTRCYIKTEYCSK